MTATVWELTSGVLYGLIVASWAAVLRGKLDSPRRWFLAAVAGVVAVAGGGMLARGGTTGLVLTYLVPVQTLLYPFAWPSADSRLVHWGLGANVLATVGLALMHSLA